MTATAVVVGLLRVGVVDTARSSLGGDLGSPPPPSSIALLIAATCAVRVPRGCAPGVVVIAVLAGVELAAMSLHSIPAGVADRHGLHEPSHCDDGLPRAEQDAGLVVALTDDGRTADYEVPGLRPNANVLAAQSRRSTATTAASRSPSDGPTRCGDSTGPSDRICRCATA